MRYATWEALHRRVARVEERMVALGLMRRCAGCGRLYALSHYRAADAALCLHCMGGDS